MQKQRKLLSWQKSVEIPPTSGINSGGWRNSVAAGFPQGKRPRFPTRKCPFEQFELD